MLKHKIRKSRKNILSLLDYANEHEDDGKFPEYSEIKKPSRKEQKKKKEENNREITDKKNKSRSKSEARAGDDRKNKTVETQTTYDSPGMCYYMPQMLQMPVLVPCPVTRRMSPAEDYMMTLTGVGNLIDQQQQLLRLFKTNNTKDVNNVKNISANSDNNDAQNVDSSKHTSHNSLDKFKASSYGEVGKDMTGSSSSSMQTLRRILEIEELRKFSDNMDIKIGKKNATTKSIK